MLRFLPVAALWALAACSPTFNWREVRSESAPLKAMFPCKPDKASRPVAMAGREVEMQGTGCDAGGAAFAVFTADIADAARLGEVLAQWQGATLANMRGTSAQPRPFVPPGALALPQSLQVEARGKRADGSAVQSRAAYFARGSRVFQAVIYADSLPAQAADIFFEGLRFE